MDESEIHDEADSCRVAYAEIDFLSRKILDLNNRLVESEKSKSKFISLIANQLNNPMTALLGLIPHLAPPEGSKTEPLFEMVSEEVLALDFFIQNLIAASEIENGEVSIGAVLVDPVSLIEDAKQAVIHCLKQKNSPIEIEDELHSKIVCDSGKLYLMLRNLLANACAYGQGDRPIKIRIAKQGEMVEFTVTNYGEGPKLNHKLEIFNRFINQKDGTRGLGIGLNIVRDYSEQMDGSIDYTSENGIVRFILTLPYKDKLSESTGNDVDGIGFESFEDAIEL